MNDLNPDVVIAYCDGGCRGNSKKENIGGYGVALFYKGHKKEIYQGFRNTTNNRMEITAAISALKQMKRKDIPVEIRTDSAYLCNCINNRWYVKWMNNGWMTSGGKTVENRDLWNELIELINTFNQVSFTKVKGHSTDEGNNLADKLANDAMDSVN
ncbi:ribonuclease H family protein [Staphylococcus equorum]|uniref:ribonuclease H n=1 Tax=Staphylococcus equorum TaxID=246432 RepID=A0A9X4LGJ3_9STAP|nr:ribonuclease H [Staphylococcus equorum]MDG0860365.1 ribonuclease HI [Staphylococcus equorum]